MSVLLNYSQWINQKFSKEAAHDEFTKHKCECFSFDRKMLNDDFVQERGRFNA